MEETRIERKKERKKEYFSASTFVIRLRSCTVQCESNVCVMTYTAGVFRVFRLQYVYILTHFAVSHAHKHHRIRLCLFSSCSMVVHRYFSMCMFLIALRLFMFRISFCCCCCCSHCHRLVVVVCFTRHIVAYCCCFSLVYYFLGFGFSSLRQARLSVLHIHMLYLACEQSASVDRQILNDEAGSVKKVYSLIRCTFDVVDFLLVEQLGKR